jgi:hypothetical protein
MKSTHVVLNDVIKMSNVVDVLLEAIPELRNEVSGHRHQRTDRRM